MLSRYRRLLLHIPLFVVGILHQGEGRAAKSMHSQTFGIICIITIIEYSAAQYNKVFTLHLYIRDHESVLCLTARAFTTSQ